MARKFWERVGANRIRFYTDPQEYVRDDIAVEIARLQAILALPDSTKAIMAAGLTGVTSEADFDKLFQGQIDELADINDYWDYDQQTEEIITVLSGWLSPADMTLGPGTVVAVSSEANGNLAIGAIDKIGANIWETDGAQAPHEIIFDLGYSKRIDGIRFRVGPSVAGPEAYHLMQVYVNNGIPGLTTQPLAHVGVDLDHSGGVLADPWLEFDLTARNGRYVRVVIDSTDAGNNRSVVRDIEMRVRARTFGI